MGSHSIAIVPLLLVASFLVALISYVLPLYQRYRDDQFYKPHIRTNDELVSLGACNSGNVTIHLGAQTLNRLESVMGIKPVDNVELSYISTYGCSSNNKKTKQEKEHILLVHTTGTSSTVFTYSHRKGDKDDDKDQDQESLWINLQNKGYDLTAIDMRGHGLSEITDGPYSVELLGADLATFVRQKFPNSKIHCHGISAGFGACMSMTIYDSDIVQTLTGSGFLFDRSRRDVVAYIFSREPVVRLLGLWLLGYLGEIIMKISNKGYIYNDAIRTTHMNGYVHLSKAWLGFNISHTLKTLSVPILYMIPEYDEDLGHTRTLVDEEIQLMPDNVNKEVIEFAGHSHLMLIEDGGAPKIANTVHAFIEKQ